MKELPSTLILIQKFVSLVKTTLPHRLWPGTHTGAISHDRQDWKHNLQLPHKVSKSEKLKTCLHPETDYNRNWAFRSQQAHMAQIIITVTHVIGITQRGKGWRTRSNIYFFAPIESTPPMKAASHKQLSSALLMPPVSNSPPFHRQCQSCIH